MEWWQYIAIGYLVLFIISIICIWIEIKSAIVVPDDVDIYSL